MSTAMNGWKDAVSLQVWTMMETYGILMNNLKQERGSKKKNIIDVSCVKTQETQFYSLFCKMNNIT